MDRKEAACALHEKGANCAQAVLCAFAESLGLRPQVAMRIASGFGGGMGRMGGTCGAVTGAFMALGMRHGMTEPEQKEIKEKNYAMVREFADRFRKVNGSLTCRDLLGCDLGTPEGMAEAKAKNLLATRCVQLIGDAVRITEEMM